MLVRKDRYYIVDKTDILKPVLIRFASYSRIWAKYNLRRYFNSGYYEVLSGRVAKKYKLKIHTFNTCKFRVWISIYYYPDSHNITRQKRKTYRTIQRRKKIKLNEIGRTCKQSPVPYCSKN